MTGDRHDPSQRQAAMLGLKQLTESRDDARQRLRSAVIDAARSRRLTVAEIQRATGLSRSTVHGWAWPEIYVTR